MAVVVGVMVRVSVPWGSGASQVRPPVEVRTAMVRPAKG